MKRVTFGVSASSFTANMAVKQNAIDYSHAYPMAAEAVQTSFYVDDCLTGAANTKLALTLQQQLTDLFSCAGFVLRKWNSNNLLEVFQKVSGTSKPSPRQTSIPRPLVSSGMSLLTSSALQSLNFRQAMQ